MAATSTHPSLFLAPKGSVLDLFQRLYKDNRFTPPRDDFGCCAGVKQDGILLPNPTFLHSDLYKTVVRAKHQLAPVPTATPRTHNFLPVVGEYVPIEFETLAYIWLMVRCYEMLESVEKAIEFLGINVDGEGYDLLTEFDLPRKHESESMPVTIEALFSIVLDAFFIERRPPRTINILLVNACSPILGEYEDSKGEALLVEKQSFTHDGHPYLMTIYGKFVLEYMQTFMTHYTTIWSINQGQHV